MSSSLTKLNITKDKMNLVCYRITFEQSIYQICKDAPILRGIYSNLSDSLILEFSRLPITASGRLIESANYKPSKIDNLALNLLADLNEKNLKKDDDLSLLAIKLIHQLFLKLI